MLTVEDISRIVSELEASFSSGTTTKSLYETWELNLEAVMEIAMDYAIRTMTPEQMFVATLMKVQKEVVSVKMRDFMIGFNVGFKCAVELETRRQAGA